MPIIEVTHLTKEYRLGALQSIKHTALDDIATGTDLAAKTWNGCLTLFEAPVEKRAAELTWGRTKAPIHKHQIISSRTHKDA